jgi:hypothetical protein
LNNQTKAWKYACEGRETFQPWSMVIYLI